MISHCGNVSSFLSNGNMIASHRTPADAKPVLIFPVSHKLATGPTNSQRISSFLSLEILHLELRTKIFTSEVTVNKSMPNCHGSPERLSQVMDSCYLKSPICSKADELWLQTVQRSQFTECWHKTQNQPL